ncbi:hypothetical protein AVEN_62460-1 [Araneus ventricosus]|uniref:Uncharacterized protein n=1 Tax=Araneus ventricosus TaxID=182803 RepID=A0A4Y2RNR8_ARAVE|nr:hypothetical protein AVEN_62460-1 [Araneus ventricosus]
MPIDEAAETPKCSPGTSNTVPPFDISPVPNIKKRTTTRGRKATRSSLITGSPYKDQLTKSLEKSAPKKTSLSVPGSKSDIDFVEKEEYKLSKKTTVSSFLNCDRNSRRT